MSDAPRSDRSRVRDATPEADRDAKIEQLLLDGLDHYFAARYSDAINVWTRALFLDRSHARARAYIERARSALAERQRQSEQLLHDGLSAFQRGDADSARRLLHAAIASGAPEEEAHAVLGRLDRLDQPRPASRPRRGRRAADRPADAVAPAATDWRLVTSLLMLLTVVIVVLAIFASEDRISWSSMLGGSTAPSMQAPPVVNPGHLPVPRRGELALARARALAARGHLHDALRMLTAVRATDPEKADADRLRADLQRHLRGMETFPVAAEGGRRQP